MERLGHTLAQADRRGSKVAVLFVDLDNFKLVNDSLGHDAGDRLLVAVAERLRRCLRPGDTAARLGGDEFTVLLEGDDIRDAIQVAERVAEALRAPFDLEERQIFISASIGIVLNTTNQDEPANLLRNANLALYQAKGSGKVGYAVFDPGMSTYALEHLELGNDLRQAKDPRCGGSGALEASRARPAAPLGFRTGCGGDGSDPPHRAASVGGGLPPGASVAGAMS